MPAPVSFLFPGYLAPIGTLAGLQHQRPIRALPLVSATIMVYSTRHDKNADREISDRTNRPAPDLFVPGRDLRYRSRIQQHRGMVAIDSGGRSPTQGSAVLSSARGEFGIRIRRLRFRTEPAAGRVGRADPPFAGRRDFREG